jgi:nicotinate-nucleotide adenylyltransferase
VSACAEIGVMRRPGDTIDLPALETKIPGLTQKLRFMDAPLVDISASRIRQQVAAGENVSQFTHPQVYNYIQEHNLYT